MSKIINREYKSNYYDYLDENPLLPGDKVKVTFPNGSVIETEIHLKGKCVFSSPGFGDRYEESACIYVDVFGLKHSDIIVERKIT